MRRIDVNRAKLKDYYDEERWYLQYLQNLKTNHINTSIDKLEKQYEIFYYNILGGKIILLNKDFLPKGEEKNQDLFFDYKTAYKAYNYWLNIYDPSMSTTDTE